MNNNQEKPNRIPKSNDVATSENKMDSSDVQEVKPLKPEQKPFEEFVIDHLIPTLEQSLQMSGRDVNKIELKQDERPVVGGQCWQVYCQMDTYKKFWLTFNSNNISSIKNFALSEDGTEPGLLESFLIDEKKITLALLVSRVLQRLNGQKWLGAN